MGKTKSYSARQRAEALAVPLLSWYSREARPLPWRETTDPYAIWVSEIMLQQTQVKTALPYWHRFLERFPKVEDLAAAPEEEVLKAWQGLGYYRRARNLHRAAGQVVREGMPDTEDGWRGLPGVGAYTAAAIHGFTAADRTVVVDGNVIRVICRVFSLDDPPGAGRDKKVKELAAWATPSKDHHIYNQAIMEIGALVCTPKSPNCNDCPLGKVCTGSAAAMAGELPKPKPAKILPLLEGEITWVLSGEKVLLRQRRHQELWGGLYEPMGLSVDRPAAMPSAPEDEPYWDGEPSLFMEIKHQFSHFKIRLCAGVVEPENPPAVRKPYGWFPFDRLPPLPTPFAKSLAKALKDR